jgi:hypothetical protein
VDHVTVSRLSWLVQSNAVFIVLAFAESWEWPC